MNKESEINVWFDHLDETPEERVSWAEVDQPAGASIITEDQELLGVDQPAAAPIDHGDGKFLGTMECQWFSSRYHCGQWFFNGFF